MSDLNSLLRQRKAELSRQRAELQARIKADNETLTKVLAAENGIDAVLQIDDSPSAGSQASFIIEGKAIVPKNSNPPPLAECIKDVLADGEDHETHDLIDVAKIRGVDFSGKDPWKSVNMTLLGLQSGKSVRRVEGNRWRKGP
jgi:hypothetical protein